MINAHTYGTAWTLAHQLVLMIMPALYIFSERPIKELQYNCAIQAVLEEITERFTELSYCIEMTR
jgi:hypothetical protein